MADPTPAPIVPPPQLRSKLCVQDVRDFIWDRTIDDNPLELDLRFTDVEVQNAMRFAAMRYNETSPFVDTVDERRLPYGMMFLTGTAYGLYLMELQKLTGQDVSYTAGSLTTDIYGKRIAHLKEFVKLFKEEFMAMVKERKTSINIEAAYASY